MQRRCNAPDAPLQSGAQQSVPDHEQIGETAADPWAELVLRQAAIACLGEAEHPFDHADAVLDLGANTRLRAVLAPLHRIDHPAVAVAAVGEVLGVLAFGACSRITAVCPRYACSPWSRVAPPCSS